MTEQRKEDQEQLEYLKRWQEREKTEVQEDECFQKDFAKEEKKMNLKGRIQKVIDQRRSRKMSIVLKRSTDTMRSRYMIG